MAEVASSSKTLRAGVFEVDLRAGEVRKGGAKVRLQEQPFRVLAMLLERPGEVVTREELQKKLWAGDTFVDFDNGLNTAINKIREALGDSAESPRFVETLPRRGYRFIAPVEALVAAPPPPLVAAARGTSLSPESGHGREVHATAGVAAPAGRPLQRSLPWAAGMVLGAMLAAAVALLLTREYPTPPQPSLTQFQILPPEGTPFVEFALSPDGRRLAFVSMISGTERRLWVRSLDELTPRPLPGTENAGWPFWSTDSRAIAFFAGGKLKKVEASGGPVQTLCDAAGAGGTWNRDGVILFTGLGRLYRVPEAGGTNQMVWFDRKGAKLGTVGEAGAYTHPAISPDGAKLAVELPDPKVNTRDIWVYDLKRGTGSRLTFDPADDTNPAWSPDGSQIMFTSQRQGEPDIYQKPANGLGKSQLIFESRQRKWVDDLSPDGRYVIYTTSPPPLQLWALPLFGERKPFAFVQGSFYAWQAQFSPNGRYVAYASDETGRWEVYVQTFPEHQGKWQVSTSGGSEPMWRRDGKELFYLSADNKLMAIEVKTDSPQFEAGIPKPLFEIQLIYGAWRNPYVASPDGQRFLMIVPVGESKPSPITVVVNWPALLKKH